MTAEDDPLYRFMHSIMHGKKPPRQALNRDSPNAQGRRITHQNSRILARATMQDLFDVLDPTIIFVSPLMVSRWDLDCKAR